MPAKKFQSKTGVQLSKSEYIMFLKHPAWLWLKKHDKKKLPEVDENLQATFNAGIDFEVYADERFPAGIQLGFSEYNEYLDLPKKTKKALEDGHTTLYQGRFEAENITCICDIVNLVDKNTFDLYEVKSSTKVKPEHYLDLAFQVVVLETAGYKVNNIGVVHVNSDYVKKGEIDPFKLSEVTMITDKVREKIEETKENILKAFEVIKSENMLDPSPRFANLGCLAEWLDIYQNLGHKIDDYSIYNLIAPGTKRLGELEDLGITLIKDIPDDFNLTAKQQVQVKVTKSGERLIEKEKIKEFLKNLVYPLHFLDYESAMSLVPVYDGTKPYQHLPFQYSLHTIEKLGGEIKHTGYLHQENTNPIPDLLKKLRKDIGPKGSVIVWYKNFETTRNSEMAEMFPEYKDFLDDVNERVIDLLEPFGEGWFADKDFFGSASIKYVLPVLVPSLSYKVLEIQEGATAQRLWMESVIKGNTDIDQEELFANLIEYCRLDTLAMVEIWKVLENL